MLLEALTLLLVSAVAVADVVNARHATGPGPLNTSWIPSFTNLVAFGDSYTEENRLEYFINHGGSAPPPGLLLPESTVTPGGGITWDRRVATSTGAKLYNYAVSGAVCDNNIVARYFAPISAPFPDVVYEVNAFIADIQYINATTHHNTLYTNRKKDNTVYAIWIGTNDLGPGAFMTDSSFRKTTIPDYIDCIYKRFDQIYANDGRYFVLMNNAPLHLSPLYAMPDEGGLVASHYWVDKPANTSEVSGKIKEYNFLINSVFDYRTPYELLVAKRYPGASIAVFDVHSLMTDMYNNPTEYFDSPAHVTDPYFLCDPLVTSCVVSDLSLDNFMWFDELHPSRRSDEIIGAEFVNVVEGSSKYATYW